VRSRSVRAAVLERCGGFCENPDCPNPGFQAFTAAGDPILQVDHIQDLAADGADHVDNMIALCPNCHAVKTLGRDREQLRDVLVKAALKRRWVS